MPIDKCKHDFMSLATSILPDYYLQLAKKITNPISMKIMRQHGKGHVAIIRQLDISSDFAGCYVLIEEGRPVYVGISRSVIKRLRQHVNGRTHFDASLAYRIAKQECPHGQNRDEAMVNPEFMQYFENAKSRIAKMQVAYVEIDNPLERYVFEAYAAMKLDTCAWNTFETH